MPSFTIAGQLFHLEREGVEEALGNVLPDPLRDHHVVVRGRRFPPKQVVAQITGLDRADSTTHQARRILRRLGFVALRAARGSEAAGPSGEGPYGGRQAEALEPFRGKWVALASPTEVVVTMVAPRITVVAQPTLEMGRQAARLLLRRLEGPERPTEFVRLEPALIHGWTGPPSAPTG